MTSQFPIPDQTRRTRGGGVFAGAGLLMLVDRANARMVLDGDRTAIHTAKKLAAQLIEVST